uniref:Uncharacterized protein n=1 Tax=Molossus molossus TaxID=27622 RepID=A0A7J8HC96_MOLMO|nr:hypothetical protein HJG59_011087 [Molossus molossus]
MSSYCGLRNPSSLQTRLYLLTYFVNRQFLCLQRPENFPFPSVCGPQYISPISQLNTQVGKGTTLSVMRTSYFNLTPFPLKYLSMTGRLRGKEWRQNEFPVKKLAFTGYLSQAWYSAEDFLIHYPNTAHGNL